MEALKVVPKECLYRPKMLTASDFISLEDLMKKRGDIYWKLKSIKFLPSKDKNDVVLEWACSGCTNIECKSRICEIGEFPDR